MKVDLSIPDFVKNRVFQNSPKPFVSAFRTIAVLSLVVSYTNCLFLQQRIIG
jgi:hypothetical protein